MMPSTAMDHVRADLAWDHRNYGTDGDRATRRAAAKAARNHKGRRRDGFSITGMTITHADRNGR
jgi:hypothetical protein